MSTHPHTPLTKESQHFRYLECFTVVLYDKTSSLGSVDEARRELFCQKNRTMESIPPTQDALLQHCKRVAYQAGIWKQVNWLSSKHPPLKDMVGHLTVTACHGFLYGVHYLCNLRPAVNL